MKVIIADSDPRTGVIGGVGVYAASLAARLARHDDVVFIGKAQVWETKMKTPYEVVLANKKAGQNNLQFLRSLFSFARSFHPEKAVFHAQRPDWIIPFRHRPGRKVVTLHGSHYKNIALKKGRLAARIYGYMERWGLRIADCIVAVDAETKREYEAKYAFTKGKIIVVPVGIDTALFAPLPKAKVLKELGLAAKRKIFLFVGRLSKEKRVELMIKQLRNDETLLVVGVGEEESRLRSLAAGKDVQFLGRKGQQELIKYYSAADALLLFSTHEGLPTVALEAMACGTPVVATKVGELPRLITPGKTGFLVNGKQYRKAMDQLREARTVFTKECRKTATAYDWEQVSKRLEQEAYR